MGKPRRPLPIVLLLSMLPVVSTPSSAADLERLLYRNPGLVVDLGVGLWAWPLPMDHDGDGDMDLVVSCPDGPYNGTYLFENPGGSTMPVFRRARRIGPGLRNLRVSHVRGSVRVLEPGHEYVDFLRKGLAERRKIHDPAKIHPGKLRANQWHYVDWEGDGDLDLLVGVGDWTEYGWDDAYDESGRWTRGPLRGFVYLIRNDGDDAAPRYGEPSRIEAGGAALEVFGWPSPCVADFDGDGDLDIVCGEFLDKLTLFENLGSRAEPRYARGALLADRRGVITMDLQMIVPVAVDWDGDGDVDLVVGQEDGRVALLENRGHQGRGVGAFARPRFFRQEAHEVKFGALSTPCGVDWDEDGDDDIVCGNTAGYIGFIENLDGADPPRWAAPRYLEAGGEPIRIQAGYNGSIQGPCEAKWGYTTLTVADWDGDGRRDILVNSIWGEVLWYRNDGKKGEPSLAPARRVEVAWEGTPPKPAWLWWSPRGSQLVTQWRTTPVAADLDRDGLVDLVMLDHEGYLSLYGRRRRGGRLELSPPRRVFVDPKGKPLRLNSRRAGGSGRRKLCVVDWDRDGHLDVLVNSANVDLLRGSAGEDGRVILESRGPLARRNISKHTTSPTVIDLDRDGVPELLVGAEDGYFYHLRR